MAGRGTDIQLGGNIDMLIKQQQDVEMDTSKYVEMEKTLRKKVSADKETAKAAGGLYIIGTERHESRRIDNQLRGRSGRQGDPADDRPLPGHRESEPACERMSPCARWHG